MKRLIIAVMVLGAAIVMLPQRSEASLWVGSNNYAGDSAWTATVQWHVYVPGDITNPLGENSAYYLYFYQVKNTSGPSGSSLKQFTVGNPFKAVIVSAGDTTFGAGSVQPEFADIAQDSTAWSFYPLSSTHPNGHGYIDPSDDSYWLFYRTSAPPQWVHGSLQNGGLSHFDDVPGPTPEPASAALLGMGLIGFVGSIIRKKFKT